VVPQQGSSGGFSAHGFMLEAPNVRGILFVVEGVAYRVQSGFGQRSGMDNGLFYSLDGLIYPLVLVFPDTQHYFPYFVHGTDEVQGEIYWQKDWTPASTEILGGGMRTTEGIVHHATKVADVDFGYIYFVDNGKIVFQKSNEEFDSVFDMFDTQNYHIEERQKLLPILEQLIRENIKPQEPEMEAETNDNTIIQE